MAVAISFRRQRVPMVSAAALEDRTRPAVEPAAWMADQLRRTHWSLGVRPLDLAARPAAPKVRPPARMSRPATPAPRFN